MEQEILHKLEENEKKLDSVYKSVESMRKYFLWTLVVTVILIVLPLIGFVFVIPKFLATLDFKSLGL